MKKFLKNKKGFTLVELVVVIAILAILALILVPSVSSYVSNADTAKKQANARSLYMSAMLAKETADPADMKAKALELAGDPSGTITIDFASSPIKVNIDGVSFNGVDFGTEAVTDSSPAN